jgi:Zn-dependent protease
VFQFDPETLIPRLILVSFFLLVGFPVHEFAHAYAAWRLGDGTAKLFGRLTLNPAAHFDPIGALMLALSALSGTGFIIGWAKPTPVNPSNLRDRRNGEVIVALAGPVSNLVMAVAASLVFRILSSGTAAPERILTLIAFFVLYNVGLAIFNLIPIPPLDGSTLLFRLLPYETAYRLRPLLAQYGILVLLGIVFFGGAVIGGILFTIVGFLLG